MIRRIHLDDHAHAAETPVGAGIDDLLLRLALEHDAEAAPEEIGLLRDLADVVVADDRMEGVEAFRLAVVQVLQPAQLAPLFVRDAPLAIRPRCDQVESVDGRHRGLRSFSAFALA